MLVDVDELLKDEEDVHSAPFGRLTSTDDVLRCVTYFILSGLHSLIFIWNLYSERAE